MPSIRSSILAFLFLLPGTLRLWAQTDSSDTGAPPPGPSISKLAIVGGVTAGGFVYGHILQSNLWWKGERSAFHVDWEHDWTYALGSDKLGHFFFPYLTANIYDQAFLWCGVDSTASRWLSSGLALAYESYVEVKDGFSKEWGFSWGDFGADFLGAAYPVMQHHIPALEPFDWKVSFWPSEKFRNGEYGAIIDDYESTYHWLSIDVHRLLPESLRDVYPKWLNVAIGHSVKDLDLKGAGTHEIYLALDWNLEGLPGDGWFWNLLKRNLNYYHLPSPAVRIYPGVVWYGLKF